MILFVVLILFAVFLYIRGFKISALIIFFFFITDGFNLVPDEVVDLGVPLTKNADYAFFMLLGFFTISFFSDKGFFRIDTYVIYLIVFFTFLFACIIYNRYVLGIGWGEIIRTVRYLFFWLAYFVFRSLDKEQLLGLLKCLFWVTVATSCLFLLQIVINKNILVEVTTSTAYIFGMKLPRFYNQPSMLHYFVFIGIYYNPNKGIVKYATATILIAALLGAFHRSLMGFFFLAVAIGFILKLPKLRQIQIVTVGAFMVILVALFAGNRFVHSRTFIDLKRVTSGSIVDADIDVTDLTDATFTFRIAHLLERNEYIREKPGAMLFGGALLTEDSKMLDKFFDFKIGLIEELTDQIIQIDTADISYSLLLLRYGYLGTFIYLLLYFYLLYYFFKNRDNKVGFFSLLYMIMIFGVSFFSSNLALTITFLLPMISYLIIKKTNAESE